ncbi:AI-2E family transporter [Chitinimonas sp.]|uniref:AI-2E family transporter n=1 Tax=Chitinimonas sp. TaxID=1934313 RepID=UPI0035AFFC29
MRPHRSPLAIWIRYWPLALLPVALWLLYLLKPVLAPFVTAAVLGYILEPMVAGLEGRRWPRTLAVTAVMLGVMLLFIALLLILLPLFGQQLKALYGYLPQLMAWLRDFAGPWLTQHAGLDPSVFDAERVKAWLGEHGSEAGQLLKDMLPSLTSRGIAMFGFIGSAVLLPVVLFYFLRDWDSLLNRCKELVPPRWQSTVDGLSGEVDGVLGQYLRGQLSVMLIMALFYATGLWLTGLSSSLAIGVIAGLLVIVPYLGVITGVLLATLTAVLQFHSLAGLLPVWGVFLLGQLLEGFVVTPRLVGERIGLHPVAVIFALMAFGQLFGFIGILLALPLAAVTLVAIRRVREQYFESGWYRR